MLCASLITGTVLTLNDWWQVNNATSAVPFVIPFASPIVVILRSRKATRKVSRNW